MTIRKIPKGMTRKRYCETELKILQFKRRITTDPEKKNRIDREIEHIEKIKDHVDPESTMRYSVNKFGPQHVRGAEIR